MWYLVCGFSKFALHLEFDLIVNTLHCFYQVLILQGLILLNTLHPHKSYFTGNVFFVFQNRASNKDSDEVDLNVQEAWQLGYSGKGVVVTIMDDGLDHTHPDLSANYVILFSQFLLVLAWWLRWKTSLLSCCNGSQSVCSALFVVSSKICLILGVRK